MIVFGSWIGRICSSIVDINFLIKNWTKARHSVDNHILKNVKEISENEKKFFELLFWPWRKCRENKSNKYFSF